MDHTGDIARSKIVSLQAETDPHWQTFLRRESDVKSQVEEARRLIKSRDADAFPIPSCVDRLPPELVAEIFLATPLKDRAAMRRVCVQVCRAWRKIAISTPRLWNTVSFVLITRKFDSQMSFMRTLCERAGRLPLSISLHYKAFNFQEKFPANQSPIPTLTPYLSRIEDLSLSLSEAGLQSFCQLPVGSFPSLDSCTIVVSVRRQSVERLIPITVFESACRLRSFTLDDMSAPYFDLSLLRLPSHLVYLSIRSTLTPSDLLDILRQCPNLEELDPVEIELNESYAPNYAGEVIVLPRLHCLSLYADLWDSEDTFFQHFTVPSLRKLDLRIDGDDAILLPRSLKFFLLRSLCPLEHLSLGMTEMDSETLLECLRAVPSLVILEMDHATYPLHRVLDALTFVPGTLSNLVPKLQTISIIDSDDDTSADESFARMVESRWWADVHGADSNLRSSQISRLTRAEFANTERESPININTNAVRRISKLREQGLDVTLE